MIAKVDDAPMPPPPPRKIAPEELFTAALEPPALTPTPLPAPRKTKKKPKPKKTSVAAGGASLDVATARLQKAIATPVEARPESRRARRSPTAASPEGSGPPPWTSSRLGRAGEQLSQSDSDV